MSVVLSNGDGAECVSRAPCTGRPPVSSQWCRSGSSGEYCPRPSACSLLDGGSVGRRGSTMRRSSASRPSCAVVSSSCGGVTP